MLIKYTKSLYENKIEELQGFWDELNGHLDKLVELRDRISDFWEDENADTTYNVLKEEILSVNRTMRNIQTNLDSLKNTVKIIDDQKARLTGDLGDALDVAKKILK